MAVVVDQREAAAIRGRPVAMLLEATTHPGEAGQRAQDGRVRAVQFGRDGNRGECIAHIVFTGQVQQHVEIGPALALTAEAHLRARQRLHRHRAHAHAGRQPVADHRPFDAPEDGLHARVVGAHHRGAIEGHAVQELDEGPVQALHRVPVGVHVVLVDVGDDRQHRAEFQEGGIAFVRLDDDELALAEPRIGAGGRQGGGPPQALPAPLGASLRIRRRGGSINLAADHEGRIQPGLDQDGRHQRARRRLAMRAGDRDAAAQPHQLGQHGGAWHHRDLPRARGQHLRVVRGHGRARHQHLGMADMRCGMADLDAQPQAAQPLGGGALGRVGTADLEAELVQDLGDAAHAGTTDADEMQPLQRVLHFNIPSISSATRAAARGRASERALSPIACSASRSRPLSRPCSFCGVSSVCGRWMAAPCWAMNTALARWWEVVLTTSGTSTAAQPAAHSSLTVIAPARQTTTSAQARAAAMSSMKGRTSAVRPASV
mmetsp:Transcript_6954/g.29338  ORF Transcript_6954/g.29338 Transcript_6954/m.29338 type:complete len:488 (-) Transcript_6954:357-1820(-)